MNIAFVHRRYDNIGGTERDLYELVGWFLRFGHEVHLYCGEFRIPPQERTVSHRIPYFQLGETAKLLSFAFFAPRMARNGQHNVVISFSKVFKQDVARCGGGTHRGFLDAIAQVRGPVNHALRWPKDRATLYVEKRQFSAGNYRRIIAISEVVKNELIHIYNVPADRIVVIYDGVDTSLYHPKNRETYGAATRKRYGIEPNHTLLLFVGSGFLRKGLEFLLQALSDLKKDDLRLLVVGGDAKMSHYKDVAHRLGIADRVTFVGPQREVHRFYGAADLLILPSVQEAFGNVVLEALACGLPAITTRNAGVSEILEGSLRNYILPRHDDIKEMTRMIKGLGDSRLRAELSMLARKTAEKYTLEANAKAIEKLCETLAMEKAGRGER